MSTAELKINVIQQITNLKDANVIEQIQRLLDFEVDKKPYVISAKQTKRIAAAKKEYAEGKTLTEKQANKEIDQWLSEK